MPTLTKKQISANKKAYKNKIEQDGKQTPIDKEEVLSFIESVQNLSKDTKIEVEKALDNDFSNFNNLNKYYRNCISMKAVFDMEKEVGTKNMTIDNPNVVQYLKNNMMNCALHNGLSLLKDDSTYASIGKNFSHMLLDKTLQAPSQANKDKVINELGADKGNELLKQNLEKQKIIAKTLFLAQLGKYNLKEKGAQNAVEYNGNLSETIVHGGRTNIILPYGGDQQEVMDSIYGKDPEQIAGLHSRTAATHYVTRQKMNEDGSIKSVSKEQSPSRIMLHKIFPHQFGMNIAVGGIGETGPDKKMILPTGSAGHMYLRQQLGDRTTCGSLLVGFESSDSGTTSNTGHKHNWLAKSAQQSAFLADKKVVGKKTDGRTVDLSALQPEKFIQLMKEFDKVYSSLQKNENTAQLDKINSLLSGKRLNEKDLIENLAKFSFDKTLLTKTISSARRGSILKPAKPNIVKRILNTMTFGKAFKKDMVEYEQKLQDYENARQTNNRPQLDEQNIEEPKSSKWPLDDETSNQLKSDTLAKSSNNQKSPPYSNNSEPTITNQIPNNN